jgi:hypothetical protein
LAGDPRHTPAIAAGSDQALGAIVSDIIVDPGNRRWSVLIRSPTPARFMPQCSDPAPALID